MIITVPGASSTLATVITPGGRIVAAAPPPRPAQRRHTPPPPAAPSSLRLCASSGRRWSRRRWRPRPPPPVPRLDPLHYRPAAGRRTGRRVRGIVGRLGRHRRLRRGLAAPARPPRHLELRPDRGPPPRGHLAAARAPHRPPGQSRTEHRQRHGADPRSLYLPSAPTLSSGPCSRISFLNKVVRSPLRAPSAGRRGCDLRKAVRRVGIEPTTRWLGVA